MIVVSNSTILIGLPKVGKLDLLPKIFSKIYIPMEVSNELIVKGGKKPGSQKIKKAQWIESKVVKDTTQVNLLTATLQKGEAEVLCLAKELHADLVAMSAHDRGFITKWACHNTADNVSQKGKVPVLLVRYTNK